MILSATATRFTVTLLRRLRPAKPLIDLMRRLYWFYMVWEPLPHRGVDTNSSDGVRVAGERSLAEVISGPPRCMWKVHGSFNDSLAHTPVLDRDLRNGKWNPRFKTLTSEGFMSIVLYEADH